MYFEAGSLVRSQNWDSLARYGDGAYETMAFGLSYFYTSPGRQYHPLINHKIFITPDGTIRHPSYPEGWQFQSEDNELLLLVFCRVIGDQVSQKFIIDQCSDWKTGNGRYISLAYWAEIKNWKWLRCICQTAQAFFFLLPYWNDGSWIEFKKRFSSRIIESDWKYKKKYFRSILKELTYFFPVCSSSDRTDGYLKWAIIAHNTPWPFRKLIAKEKLKQKILAYMWKEIEVEKDIHTTVGIIQTHWLLVDLL